MSDGARDALAGYLYQIFAAAGIGARAHGGLDGADQLTCDLVLLARQSRILHEVHGEDVVLQQQGPANEATAVQFKFSRNAGSTPLQPADLRDILQAFDRSRQAAGPALNLTGFVLVTNRRLSVSAHSLYQRRDHPTPFAKLKEPERNWLIIPNKKAKEVKQHYGSIQRAAEAWHAIFGRLRIFAEVTGQHWLGEALNEWRSRLRADDLPVLPAREVLRRVRLANDGAERPLLVVNIDGLDEATDEHRQELRRLLDACRTQQPPSPYALVLLLTARLTDPTPERTRDRLIRLLTSAHYPGELAHQFGLVLVRDFSDDELRLAIAELPPPLRGRLEEALRILSGHASETATLGEEPGTEPTRPPVANRALLASLRHPALWGEFLDLGPDTQGRALDGQPEALHELARRFLDRFFYKVLLRHPALPEDGVRQALTRISRRFPPREQRGRRSQHWLVPASKPGPLRHPEAGDLFHEAVSYGMIREDEEEWWRWRHGFVRDYLLTQEE
jgi:hypothetical protein